MGVHLSWQAAPRAVTPSMMVLLDCWMLNGSEDNQSLLIPTSKKMQNNLSQVGSSYVDIKIVYYSIMYIYIQFPYHPNQYIYNINII